MATTSSSQIETHGPVTLHIENGKGSVEVSTADTNESTIELSGPDVDDVRVDLVGEDLYVIAPQHRGGFLGGDRRIDMVIVVPDNSSLTTKLGSADLVATGSYDTVSVRSGSGDVELSHLAGACLVETGSGDVVIDRTEGPLRVKSGSGDVTVQHTAAEVSVSTGSGDVEIGEAMAATQVKTGSGDLKIGHGRTSLSMTTGSGDLTIDRFSAGQVQLKGASSDVRLGVPAGIPVWTDVSTVSGRIHSTLEGAGQPEPGADYVEVRAKTVSGDIVLAQV
ncbi:hypothetical protein BH11ACT8_BH11ACT8_27460 [soil metagenome]